MTSVPGNVVESRGWRVFPLASPQQKVAPSWAQVLGRMWLVQRAFEHNQKMYILVSTSPLPSSETLGNQLSFLNLGFITCKLELILLAFFHYKDVGKQMGVTWVKSFINC